MEQTQLDPLLDPILLVDDEKDNLQALSRLLRGHFKVTTTTSPKEALQLLGSQTFHVIVSDQRMPTLSGVELLEKAKKLSPHSTRILLTGYTDIESVIEAINRGHIYRYIAKPWDPEELKITLKQANEAFLLRKEIEEKNQALEKSLAELSLLDKAKARFLSLVSHELNTPLTVLQSFMSLLSQSQADLNQDLQKSVSALSKAVSRFSEIVSEVLTYTRIESAGTLQLSKVPFEEKLKGILSRIKNTAEKKQIELSLESKKAIDASFDWEKMELALGKIFSAVVSRALPKTTIQMVTQNEEGHPIVDICWKGDALPAEAFKPFETGSSEMHHHQNLGLSLAIAKLIVEGHGGSIQDAPSPDGLHALKLVLK